MEVDMVSPGFDKIVPPDSKLEVIANDLLFGEGPVWNSKTGEFFWVDIIGDTIWKYKKVFDMPVHFYLVFGS
jgi:sugar lactone lactonase YvrE